MDLIDRVKIKVFCYLISLILTGVIVFLYFLANSIHWESEEVISCIILSTWVFFLLPSFRYSYLKNKDKSPTEWFRMGFFSEHQESFSPS
jgi:hypothetical protein